MAQETERGCRRLWALVSSLPEEAATWREGKPVWTVQDELAAQAVERADVWGRLTFAAVARLGGVKISDSKLPKPPQINHPGRTAAQGGKKKPERDPKVIRAWFQRHLGAK